MKTKSKLFRRISVGIVATVLVTTAVASTFAVFTGESETNIAVNSGNVEVVATLDDLALHSPTLISEDGRILDNTNAATSDEFALGGTAGIDNGELSLVGVMPGDKASFNIKITNKSSVLVKYRTVTTVTHNDGLFEGLNVQIGSTYNGDELSTDWATLEVNSPQQTIECSVELPATADKTYMDKNCTIAFKVEAVQGNVATYDKVEVASEVDLGDAISNATAPTELVLADGTYSDFQNQYGRLAGKDVVLKGTRDAIIDVSNQSHVNGVADLTNTSITFDGVTVNWKASEEYQGLKNPKKVVYKDCKINGLQYMYGDAEFINCTFENEQAWSVWTYNSEKVYFTDCTFITGGHAVLIYNEAPATPQFENDIRFTNCTFLSSDTVNEQWGHEDLVEVGDNPAESNIYNLTFTDCTYYSVRQALHGNKNSIPAERLSVIETGTTHVASVYANTQTQLDAVLATANDANTYNVYLAKGDYKLYNTSYAGKKMTFNSLGVVSDVEITTGEGNEFYSDEVIFNNVTVVFPEVSHKGLTHTNKVVYNGCTLKGTQTLYAPLVEFNDCVFEGNDEKDIYYVWTYGIANAKFTGCTFNTNGKAILCYADGAVTSNLTLIDCEFYSDGTVASNKAAVEVGTDNHAQTFNITFTNCTQSGFYANNSNNALWGNKNSMSSSNLSVKIEGVEQNLPIA